MKRKNDWIKPRQNRDIPMSKLEEIVEGICGKGVMEEVAENMGINTTEGGDESEKRRRDNVNETW